MKLAMMALLPFLGLGGPANASVFFAEFDAIPYDPANDFGNPPGFSNAETTAGSIAGVRFNVAISNAGSLSVGATSDTVSDNSFTDFSSPLFTPSLDAGDALAMVMYTGTFGPQETVTFEFQQVVRNLTFHIRNIGFSFFDFSAMLSPFTLERLSGDDDFGVQGTTILDLDGRPNISDAEEASGSFLLRGEYSRVDFLWGRVDGTFFGDGLYLQLSVVPEPATLVLLGIGLAGIGWARRKTTH